MFEASTLRGRAASKLTVTTACSWPNPGTRASHRQLTLAAGVSDSTSRLPSHVAQLRYTERMKTTTIPSIRVEPDFRAAVEAVLAEGETLSQFVEASVRASLERRRRQAEFIARGLRSRDEARRTGDYVDADTVIDGLQRKLDAARTRAAKKGR